MPARLSLGTLIRSWRLLIAVAVLGTFALADLAFGETEEPLTHPTFTTISCKSPSRVDEPARCTATVEDLTPAEIAVTPRGEVLFSTDRPAQGSFTGTCTLNALRRGAARCSIEYMPKVLGVHTITGSYPGLASTGAEPALDPSEGTSGVEAVFADPTTTAVSCTPNSLRPGESTRCKATVTDTALNPQPSGQLSVFFTTDGPGFFTSPFGDDSCRLVFDGVEANEARSCELTYTAVEPTATPHNITARLSGDLRHEGSQDTTQVRDGGPEPTTTATRTTFECDPATIDTGRTVECIASVSNLNDPGAPAPTGEVTLDTDSGGDFSEESCELGAPIAGVASCEIVDYVPTTVDSGLHSLEAAYQGDPEHTQSTGFFDLNVTEEDGGEQKTASRATFTCDPVTIETGRSVQCVARVRNLNNPNAPAPTGEVRLDTDSAGELSTESCQLGAPVNGVASCQPVDYVPSTVDSGIHTLEAAYRGDAEHRTSTGFFELNVTEGDEQRTATRATLTCDPASIDTARSVQCVASVRNLNDPGAPAPTGVVRLDTDSGGDFSEESCQLGAPVNGVASCQPVEYVPTTVDSGIHTLEAAYRGDPAHTTSTGFFELNVTEGDEQRTATRTSFECAPATIETGRAVECTASVRNLNDPGAPAPTGEVQLDTDSGGDFGEESCELGAPVNGVASCPPVDYVPSTVDSGIHTLEAAYQGDPAHTTSTGFFELNVTEGGGDDKTATRTTFECDPATIDTGRTVECIASVRNLNDPGAPAPTGEVQLDSDSGGDFGEESCELGTPVDGVASCQPVDYVPANVDSGVHNLEASYQGDAGHTTSTGFFGLNVTGAEGNERNPTSTTLDCQPTTVILGGGSVCTVVVEDTGAVDRTNPTGIVAFDTDPINGAANACNLAPAGEAKARCQTIFDPDAPGTTEITAAYTGDAEHGVSRDTAEITVNGPNGGNDGSTTLVCQPASVILGGVSICTVDVEDIGANPTTPTGDVIFASNGAGDFSRTACTLFRTGQSGARCQVIYAPSQVGSGNHRITAIYNGDGGHEPSRDSRFVAVTPPNGGHRTTTALECEPQTVEVGRATTCTATVTDIDPNPTDPTRAVVFASDSPGGFGLGGCQLGQPDGDDKASCEFTYTPSETGSGTHEIAAAYEGDPNHEPSPLTSDQVTVIEAQDDGKNPTTTALDCQPTTVILGGGAVCTAVVEDTGDAGRTNPTGNVAFESNPDADFANVCTLAPIGEGRARCQTIFDPAVAGEHEITATYEGDNRHETSLDTAQVTVNGPNGGHATATALECEPSTVILGGVSICTVNVRDTTGTPTTPAGGVVFGTDGPGDFSSGGCVLFEVRKGEARCQLIYRPARAGLDVRVITAIYTGAPGHEPSLQTDIVNTSAENGGNPTTTALQCQPDTVAVGRATTCTATVTDGNAERPLRPTGVVVFASNSPGLFDIGGCQLDEVGEGVASCDFTYTTLAKGSGTHRIAAGYAGANETHEPSPLTFEDITVTDPPPARESTTTLVCAPASVLVGAATTCTATVNVPGANPEVPGGTVRIASEAQGSFSGGGACTLNGTGQGKASCQITYTPSALGSGSHKLTAAYQGDVAHLPSQGSAQLQVATPPVVLTGIAPPNTTLRKKPRKKTAKRKAVFRFVSDQPGSRFQCKLDKKPFKPCRSPFKKKKLKPGRHTFRVRAVNPQGIADPTPAVFKWKVGKGKRR